MPNSLRKRIKKLAFQNHISEKESEIIINALYKEKPMKRIEPTDKFYLWACPNCRTDFISNGKEKCCVECGQRLEEI